MNATTNCPQCGAPRPDGSCPSCDAQTVPFRLVHREIVLLLVLCGIAVVAFLATHAAAASTRDLRLQDASAWFEAGQRALQGGQPEQAIVALRRATAIDRDNRTYRLTLANALSAANHVDETRQVLLRLREGEPEDPEVNLQLARLEAHADHPTEAIRYYQSALYGRWNPDAFDARRRVRIELVRYALARGDQRRALAELLTLSGNLPEDAAWQTTAGQLFLEAGDARRALEHFNRALAGDARNAQALAGAGRAALALGDYTAAQRYFRDAPQDLDGVAPTLRLVTLVLSNDPLAPRLPLAQRRARLLDDLSHARTRLDACAARLSTSPAGTPDTLAALQNQIDALEPALDLPALREAPDAIETGVGLLLRIEQQTATPCGPRDDFNEALLRIGERHSSDQP